MMIRAPNGTYDFIDYREAAPQAATEDMYKNNPQLSIHGGLAVAVPYICCLVFSIFIIYVVGNSVVLNWHISTMENYPLNALFNLPSIYSHVDFLLQTFWPCGFVELKRLFGKILLLLTFTRQLVQRKAHYLKLETYVDDWLWRER